MRTALHKAVLTTLVGILLLDVASTARAQDAGIRSVFADGTGTRALALGGAYAALSDDATAPAWNAAGLGLVPRSELLASHTTLYGLGFDEQYAFLALPSWRFGTLGIALRHFGVDGIELRDDNNAVLDTNGLRSETELSLAYGRVLNPAIAVGLAVKLRRLSFAGFSDSGLGFDLGLLVRPALMLADARAWGERLQLGIAAHNVARPTLRLDQDDVADPMGVRLGASYWLPLAGARSLLLALDVEKTNGMSARVHTGLELRPYSLLALRTGIHSNGFSAGTGLRWRELTVDYAYESNAFDAVQRVGIGMSFGATMVERRGAALAKSERELQERLARAFDQRQRERVRELLQQAHTAHNAGRYDEALEIATTVDVLEPGQPEARQLQINALVEKAADLEEAADYAAASTNYAQALQLDPQHTGLDAATKRCQDLSNKRAARSHELRQQFAQALDAFANDDLLPAQDILAQIVRSDASDQEAARMLERVRSTIRQRVVRLVQDAERIVRAGRLDEAAQLLERARTFDPTATEVQRAAQKLLAAQRVVSAPPTATAQRSSREDTTPQPLASLTTDNRVPLLRNLTAKERGECSTLYQSGVRAMEGGRSREAIRYWELAWSIDPEFQQVTQSLAQHYLTQGMEAFADRDLDEAVRLWENALRVNPGDERTGTYLNRARERLLRTRAHLGEAP